MAPYEALYGRKCRSPLYWKLDKRQLTSPELVQVTSEKVSIIQQRLKTTFGRQKSYVHSKRKDVSFSVGDLENITFRRIHPVFHVSILRKYIANPSHVPQPHAVELSKDLTYGE